MNKIEIITQHSDSTEIDPEHSAIVKLQELIKENPSPPPKEERDGEEEREKKDRKLKKREEREASRQPKSTPMSPNPTADWSKQSVKENGKDAREATASTTTTDTKVYSSSSESDSESDTNYDEDGFEIPQGKIPLDGHFSTEELELLVDLAKKEGFLKDDVAIKVVETSKQFGDKVVITEDHAKKEPDHDSNKQKEKKQGES